MRNNMVKVICEEASTNSNIMIVTADLGYNVLNVFYESYPNQYVNVGIAEQNMTSVAAGLALEGKKVFTYSIGSFSTLRCLEQIRNDVCYHNADVKIVALAAGFAYGALGMSHHATEDISAMKSLPNMTVFSPCDPIETRAVTRAAIGLSTPCYIRLGRGGEPNIHDNLDDEFQFAIGKSYMLFSGNDGCIFSTGSITIEAKRAVIKLKELGYNVSLYTFPTIKPIDEEVVLNCGKKFSSIIIVEEHQIYGGFASSVADVFSKYNEKFAKIIRIGMNEEYTSHVGSTDYLRKVYKMDSNSIIDSFLKQR